MFNIIHDLSVTITNIEALYVEIINKKSSKNILINSQHCQHSLIPIVNKPSRITKNSLKLIHYIITNSFTDQENLTGVLKTDISDHLPIFTISMKHTLGSSNEKVTIRKRIINANSIQEFRDILSEVNWRKLYSISNPTIPMNIF